MLSTHCRCPHARILGTGEPQRACYGEAMNRAACLIFLTLSLGACASPQGDYPSLGVRDGERMTGAIDTAAPAAPVERRPLSTDVATRVEQLRELARTTHENFVEIERRAARLVEAASGNAITTKANASAQIALAELQSAHEATLALLAELDVLLAEATLADAQTADIAAAREQVGATVAAEQAALAALSARLASD